MTKQEIQALQEKLNQVQSREMTQAEMVTNACDHKDANTGRPTINEKGFCGRCKRYINLDQIPEVEIAKAVDTLVKTLDQVKLVSNCNAASLLQYAEIIHLIKSLPKHYIEVISVKGNPNSHKKTYAAVNSKFGDMFPGAKNKTTRKY